MGDASKRVSAACGLALGAAAAAAAAAAATAAAAAAAIAPRRGNAYVDARWRMLSRYRYAHRGLHDLAAGIPENSLPAFRRAREMGYGAELDVHLTADDRLVVIHDSDLTRLCGTSRIVEDLTLDALRDLRLSGTEQTIPTLEEVLAIFERPAAERPAAERPVAERPATPLIIELKTWNGNAARLASRTMELLDSRCVSYCIESFDPYALAWLRRNRPEVIRGQLSCFFGTAEKREPFSRMLVHYLLTNVITRPDFIAYSHANKGNLSRVLCRKLFRALSVAWTVKSQEQLDACRNDFDLFIFEQFIPKA
jgi:glycerophosphoryl diester phosphodiesterase